MIENRKEEVCQQVKAYHRKHPEVWELFVQFTFDMIDKGFKNYAVSGIFERIRWEKDMGGDGLTMFKINNNYKPFYARRFMACYPQHEGFFRTRKQTSEDKDATHMPEITPEYV